MRTLAICVNDSISVSDLFGGAGQVWLEIRKWAVSLFLQDDEAESDDEQPQSPDDSPPSTPDPPTLEVQVKDVTDTKDVWGKG
jgi:hypothetical protein